MNSDGLSVAMNDGNYDVWYIIIMRVLKKFNVTCQWSACI